jgi:hypothetical protein
VKKFTGYDDLHACLEVGKGLRAYFCRAIVARKVVSNHSSAYLVIVYSETLPAALGDHARTLRQLACWCQSWSPQMALRVEEHDSVFTPVLPTPYEDESLTVLRVKGVCDLELNRLSARTSSSC